MEAKKVILLRIYFSFTILCLMGLAILVQIFRIQFVEGDRWRERQDSTTLKYAMIEPSRGNIFSSDENLMATSIPLYDIRIDTRSEALTQELFDRHIDSLSRELSALFKDKSWLDYKRDLRDARSGGNRYYMVHGDVSYPELQQLKKFPLFRLGRYKGGLIVEQRNKRELVFDWLASRTIGTVRDVKPVGIEASFDGELKGSNGRRLLQKISGGWMPVNDKDEIEPKDGHDLVTTIDLNIQDVAEHSLKRHLIENNADHGCVVLMEVSTGEIKAIANLSRMEDGNYAEDFNYAIAEATEPGSTFKMISLLAAMDDGFVEPGDSVFVGNGTYYFTRQYKVTDSHPPKSSKLSVQQAFETSSNVGISRVIHDAYNKHPEAFIEKIKSFGLGKKLGLQIEGEGEPYIKEITDKKWSNHTLTQISFGYESKLTPLQILAFYNAIANKGRLVKPVFVREIRNHGSLIKSFPTEVIRDSIASPETLLKARRLMEGVVQNGTGSVLKSSAYKIAGKTGTAQMYNTKYGYSKNFMTYQASFVGYFPADKPLYSCIVVVYAPTNQIFGGAVAAPIFKEVADKVYSNHLKIHDQPFKSDSLPLSIPLAKAGHQDDLKKIFGQLKIPAEVKNPDGMWVNVQSAKEKVVMNLRRDHHARFVVPDVVGMGLKDALYLLENAGLSVQLSGKGQVTRQSLEAGTKIQKGQVIIIELG